MVFVGFGIGTPLVSVQARAFSYLGGKSDKSAVLSVRSEAQNSQTIAFLEGAVNFDPNPGKGGGDIIMDDKWLSSDIGPSGTIVDIESSDYQGKRVLLYVIRKGDTVAQIAKMFDLNVNTVLWANDLARGASLREGQHLIILPIDGVQHTVKKEDTLKSIANKYKGDIIEILEFNDMKSGQKLYIGDIIIIPNGAESATSTSGTTTTSLSSTISKYPTYDGYYTHPIPTARRKSQVLHGNNGVDYSAPIGTTVYAAAEGVVILSQFRTGNPWFGGYGNFIVIEHPNGTKTWYAHLSAVYTQVGVRVEKGQSIGEVGNTGRSTGPHLHFEVRGAKNPF